MCFFTLNDLKDTSGTSREFYVGLIFICVGIHGSGNTNGRREIVVGELLRNLKFTKFARFWQSSLYAH
jgi:hypothetical protein